MNAPARGVPAAEAVPVASAPRGAAEPCFHCGEPVLAATRRSLAFDGAERALCCSGCEAVMGAILESGFDDYYRHRDGPAAFGLVPDDLAAALDALAVYDEPEIAERHVVGVDARGLPADGERAVASEVLLSVEGLRCGACVWLLERAVRALPGVVGASFNFSTARARVRYDATRVPLSAILGRVASVGYRARPFDAREREAGLAKESRVQLQRLFVAGIAMMQVMMYALPAYLAGDGEIDPSHERLLHWASLVLTTSVVLYAARPFFAGALRGLRAGRPGMDVPVSIGLIAAFAASVHTTVVGHGEIWFDSVAMFTFLLLGARWLEWRAWRRALRAVDDIGAAAPETALRLRRAGEPANGGRIGSSTGGATAERVPAVRLVPGDVVRVDSGERVPADGRLVGSGGAVDLSLLSGESVPVTLRSGAEVPGGALVAGAPLELVVERGVATSALSMIERLIERGAEEKPTVVRVADRVASVFVTCLLAFAGFVFVLWSRLEPSRAATVALTTLVVSCPCALSLATPAALAAATGRLLGTRLVVTRGHAIETLARVTDVVFDKTGTLTTGRPALAGVTLADGVSREEALALAAALEAGSAHPFGRALLATAAGEGDEAENPRGAARARVREIRHEAGHGVVGVREDGTELRLGSARWCLEDDAVAERWRRRDGAGADAANGERGGRDGLEASEVFLAAREPVAHGEPDAWTPLARFAFVDPLRAEARDVVAALDARGIDVHLLSGDRPIAVAAAADALGIDDARGAATPADKRSTVAALQAEGRVVLMVGDGINDAPVLALADVSLAVGDASALARTAADVVSLAPGLDALSPLLAHTRLSARVIRQNLAWAALYNATAIPAAAFGLVPPWAAALGMAASSLVVVGNALRLSRA